MNHKCEGELPWAGGGNIPANYGCVEDDAGRFWFGDEDVQVNYCPFCGEPAPTPATEARKAAMEQTRKLQAIKESTKRHRPNTKLDLIGGEGGKVSLPTIR